MDPHPAPCGARRAAGFTLVEVMVAVAILGLAAVGWLAAVGSQVRTMARASEVTVATALAQERLETIRLLAADRLPSLPDSLEEGTFRDALHGYRWEADARTLPGTKLAELTLTVSWDGGSRTLATLVPLPASGGGGAFR